jgi:hypothetical protein
VIFWILLAAVEVGVLVMTYFWHGWGGVVFVAVIEAMWMAIMLRLPSAPPNRWRKT